MKFDEFKERSRRMERGQCIHRLRSGKAICFVKVEQLHSGKYALQRRMVGSDKWEWVMSLPMFDDKEQAEKYIKEHYEQVDD